MGISREMLERDSFNSTGYHAYKSWFIPSVRFVEMVPIGANWIYPRPEE
jgi:hypothetical protein